MDVLPHIVALGIINLSCTSIIITEQINVMAWTLNTESYAVQRSIGGGGGGAIGGEEEAWWG